MTPPIASAGCWAWLLTSAISNGHTTETPRLAAARPAAASSVGWHITSAAIPAAAIVRAERDGSTRPSAATIDVLPTRAIVASAFPATYARDSGEHTQAVVGPQVEHTPGGDPAFDHRRRREHEGEHGQALVPEADQRAEHRGMFNPLRLW